MLCFGEVLGDKMPGYQINDIVRIIKKPSVNQHLILIGLVGYITKFSEDVNYLDFKEIHFDSICGETISVDRNCIEHYNDLKYENRLNEILPKIDELEQAHKIISVLENEIKRLNERWEKSILFSLLKFVDEFCILGENESCKISDFKNKFQDYMNDDFSRIIISKLVINKLKYSSIVKDGSRYFQGLSLKD